MRNPNRNNSASAKTDTGQDDQNGQRVDKWLWFSRVVKSRSLAQKLVKSGKVRLNGTRLEAAHKIVRVEDVLTITLERQVKVLKILDPGTRRGPAPEAQLLYEDLSPPEEKNSKAPETDPRKQAAPKPEGSPDKNARRALTKIKRGEF